MVYLLIGEVDRSVLSNDTGNLSRYCTRSCIYFSLFIAEGMFIYLIIFKDN